MVFAFRCKGLPHSLAPTPRNSCTRLHPAAGPSRLLEQLAGCRTSPLLLLLLFLLLLLLLLLLHRRLQREYYAGLVHAHLTSRGQYRWTRFSSHRTVTIRPVNIMGRCRCWSAGTCP